MVNKKYQKIIKLRLGSMSLSNVVGCMSSACLLLLLGILIFPTKSSTANALSCGSTECQEGYTSAYANMELGAAVASMVSVGLGNNVAIDITPKSGGAFASASAALTVSTNNETGFAVYMKSNNDGALVSSDSASEEKIKSMVGSDFTSADNANAWGYSLDGTNYQAVPKSTSSTPIINESNIDITSGNNYNLTFGVKVDSSLPAGYYTGTVTVSAVANPLTISSLSQLVYMQDMTSEICANTAAYVDLEHYVTKQLIDTRDGNKYWVAKLADGNCWMVQNLALDLSVEKTLTSADTDLADVPNLSDDTPYTFTPESSTNVPPLEGTGLELSSNTTYSWNPGQVVVGLPQRSLKQGQNINNPGLCSSDPGKSWIGAYTTPGMGEMCFDWGFVDVSDGGWRPTFTAQQGEWKFKDGTTYTGVLAVDMANRAYDAHFLTGNFYTWNAAVAGTGIDMVSSTQENATGSICPKGWRMPTSEVSYDTSFKQLTTAMGATVETIDIAPLYMVRPGYAQATREGAYSYVGMDGVLWLSAAAANKELAYVATHNTDGFGPSTIQNWSIRSRGYNVRCLAR